MSKPVKRKRARKPRERTLKSIVKTHILMLEEQKKDAKKFIRTCCTEDRVHMEGFIVGIDFGMRALDYVLEDWNAEQKRRRG